MNRTDETDRDDVRRLAEASAWRVALSEVGAETSPEFESWIAEPANEAAWDRMQATWELVGEHASAPALLALRRDALARAHRHGRRRLKGQNGGRWYAAAVACITILVGIGAFFAISAWNARSELTFATSLGERRVVTMPDGSRISLDAATRVRVRYTAEARTIDIVQGQARFDVASDVTRRFTVRARDQAIVATGTAFNVDVLGEQVLVTLIEGHVMVTRANGERTSISAARPAQAIALSEGQQLVAMAQRPPVVQEVSLDQTGAWERGQLIFENETLSAIVERINRYSAHSVRVEPAAANIRVSGVFRAGDTSTFVDTVTRYLPMTAMRNEDGSVVLKPAV
jgi:transmembrane sensor